MQAQEKILLDLDQSYPCPACKQGSLVPITLTEAWGCDRCKQIFEQRKGEANTVAKLSTPYHRQRTWQWNGRQWLASSTLDQPKAFNSLLVITLLVCLLWIILSKAALPGTLIFSMFALGLLLVVMFWVLRRR